MQEGVATLQVFQPYADLIRSIDAPAQAGIVGQSLIQHADDGFLPEKISTLSASEKIFRSFPHMKYRPYNCNRTGAENFYAHIMHPN